MARNAYAKTRLREIADGHRQEREWAADAQLAMLYEQSVYVVRAGDLIKIGISNQVGVRIKALKIANPLIEHESYFATPRLRNASRVEKQSHNALKDYRVTSGEGPGREWFRCKMSLAVATVERFAARSTPTEKRKLRA